MQHQQEKKVFIEFDIDNVASRTNSLGQSFYSITLPEGTIIDGVDYGRWNFTQTLMFPSQYHDHALVASFPWEGWEINLSHSWKDGAGEYQRETRRVTAAELKNALKQRAA
ncbi:MAG: hypothetical protein IKF96_07300 [Eggerthellaceae bacterium]|nr:hypothetical protein [Eggerthellaceae bacterium]MBR3258780.1 hypothetical protein [Eggerthellaceae bacterium]